MAKKLVLLLALIMTVNCVNAQLAVGDWRIHSSYSGEVKKMIDTPDKLYIVSAGNLFSYDKTNEYGEVYSYNSRNMLSDNNISNIFYNKNNKYLFVAYSNSNIDLIYDNGDVVNLSEIKDAIMQTDKVINDVLFDAENNRIYVATSFGLVIYDDKKHYVIESGIYEKSVNAVGIIGSNLVISYDSTIAYSDLSSRHNSLDTFTAIGSLSLKSIKGLNESKALVLNGNSVKLINVDFNNNTSTNTNIVSSGVSFIGESENDYYFTNGSTLYRVDSDGNNTAITLTTDLSSNIISYWNDIDNLWAASNNLFTIIGVGNYKLDNEGNVTTLKNRFVPENYNVTLPMSLYFGPSGKLYVNNSMSIIFGVTEFSYSPINTYYAGEWKNVTITNIPQSSGAYFETAGVSHVVEDPEDSNTYYYGNFWKGIRKVTDCQSILNYARSNSTLISFNSDYGCIVTDLDFDKYNNMWAITYVADVTSMPALHVLSSDKLKLSNTEKSDWNGVPLPQARINKGAKMLVCKKSDMVFIINIDYGGVLTSVYTNGTPTDLSDDIITTYTSFVDQDGKSYSSNYLLDIVEDKNGKVWIGTEGGVIELPRPEDYVKENVPVNHIKVPRNDGTSYADYLLDGQSVSAIAVDSSNRKWLGTTSTGIYLVSETGDEILESFSTENSYLPSDCVYDIACDPYSSSVFIGTSMGLAEYMGDSSPASEDYSNVYAYPNPVRPEYTGWITVTGLMDNSLVKITDATGNVLYTTTSEGGMITWDGCNSAGERVKTGVYYVFASQNATGNSSGAVTKILVVK